MAATVAATLAFTTACGSTVAEVTGPGPDAVRCTIGFDAGPASVPASATQLQVGIVTERECAWTAQSRSAWIQVSPTSGQGDASLLLSIAANTLSSPRTGSITVNDATYQISQAGGGPPCTYAVDPQTRNISENGGTRDVRVTTASGCAWTATSSVPWITILSPTSGTGNARIEYRVARNTSDDPRVGVITVGTATHIVLQQGD